MGRRVRNRSGEARLRRGCGRNVGGSGGVKGGGRWGGGEVVCHKSSMTLLGLT